MGKYQNLNVYNVKQRNKDFMSDDAITEVANMLNTSGQNRSQRRRLEKSLGKMETILEHSQKYLDRSAYKEYQKAVDKNYVHFFSCLALTMIEDYGWKETEENEHGQITSLIERVDKKIRKYADMGYTTEDLVAKLDELTGIVLVPDTQ
jgi:hypothetical protein